MEFQAMILNSLSNKTSWVLFLLLYQCAAILGQGVDNQCNAPLGLGDGSISDSAITASVNGDQASKARLNGNEAWCFKLSEVKNTKVTLTIDLGFTYLISAMQSQGPPSSVKSKDYFRYMGFKIYNSSTIDQDDWDICCDGKPRSFYADDKSDEIDVVATHPLNTLMAARSIQFVFITDLQWPGDDEKCFRLEILGCPLDVVAVTGLTMEAVPSGFVVATWDSPVVQIPGDSNELEDFALESAIYLAQMSRQGGGEDDEVKGQEVAASRFTVASPLWGATYTIQLTCAYQNLNISCGDDTISAEVTGCDPGQDSCLLQNQVIFRRPAWLKAAVVGEEKVELTWSSDSSGYITSKNIWKVVDNDGEEVDMYTLSNTEEIVTVTGVTGGNNYTATFSPVSTSGEELATFSFNLYILAWDGVRLSTKEIGYGAFVTDVGLMANILWNGTMRVTWSPALVLGVSWEESTPSQGVTEAAEAEDTTANDISGAEGGEANEENIVLVEDEEGDGLTASPTPVENSDATAYMYTVTLTSDEEERVENVTEINGDTIGKNLPLLTFGKRYSVSLTCHFGDVSVECGQAEVFTELPLHWTQFGDDIVVHVPAQGLGDWDSQEMQCNAKGGNLVSLANAQEDQLLVTALKKVISTPELDILEVFWIGLNMCPDNLGHLWSDGSSWVLSRLPSVDSKLSSATCCIKAVWIPSSKSYVWLGETCEALLPAICEFHPEGMVGKVESLQRGIANKTNAFVSWNYIPMYWNASSIVVRFCPNRNLINVGSDTAVTEGLKNCTITAVSSDTNNLTQTGLLPFVEYNVTISARIDEINFIGEYEQIITRTHPEKPLIVQILPSGRLHVVWAQKVSEFSEGDKVSLKIFEKDKSNNPMVSEMVDASGHATGGITLGKTYTVTVKEREGQEREESLTVQAYPPCPCEDCQLEGYCYQVLEQNSDGFSAPRECSDEETKLITVKDSAQVDLLLEKANQVRDDLWVDPDSKKIAATDESRDTAALLTEEEEFQVSDAETLAEEKKNRVCLMVSRARKAVVEEPCSIVHKLACGYKTPVAMAFPQPDEMKIDKASNWVTIDWDDSNWGWKASYVLYYQRTDEKRYKRALRMQEFDRPPVTVLGLRKKTPYTMELVADLGSGFVSSSNEFEVSTNNVNSRPGGTSPLTLGAVPVAQFQVMQLVCGSILVAACITTMLLFFATGMFYQDCIAQLAFLGTLMAAFLNLLLAHPRPVFPENENGCIVVAIVLHFLFFCAFMFLMLESLTYAHLLVTPIKSPFQKSNWLLMGFGLIVPLLTVAICAGVAYDQYADFNQANCWLNTSNGIVWGEALPIGVLVAASVALIISTVCNKETPPDLIEINLRSRQGDSHKLRWVVLALVLELTLVWSLGVSAYQTQDPAIGTVFCIFTLILAITIIGARTSLDDTFRSKMHRLCCGTELTYKRSEIVSLSGKSRVGPTSASTTTNSVMSASDDAQKNYTTKEVKTTTVIPSAEQDFVLPNTPPQKEDEKHVLVRRSYHFSDDDPVGYFE